MIINNSVILTMKDYHGCSDLPCVFFDILSAVNDTGCHIQTNKRDGQTIANDFFYVSRLLCQRCRVHQAVDDEVLKYYLNFMVPQKSCLHISRNSILTM